MFLTDMLYIKTNLSVEETESETFSNKDISFVQ
jgi:hypothetical protein